MKKFLNNDWTVYSVFLAVVMVGIWLLTKLWIPGGFAIAGHDSGLAVNAADFFKSRLFAWGPQGFGIDNSGYFGSLIMHFIDFASSKVAGVPYAGNQLNVFFWISAIFLSAAIFSRSLNNKLGKYFKYLFPVFITFNFYILQSIFIIERSKYSILVATLFFLAIYIKMHEAEIPVLRAGILASFIFLLFNGGSWLGLPLYGGLLVLGFTILIFELALALKRKSIKKFINLLIFYLIIGFGFVIFNAYSILPYSSKFLKQDYSIITNKTVISMNVGWLNNLSQASSYLNLFRLQGIPDWYAGEIGVNPDHPYADLYLNNRLLIISSFAFPILIILSFVFAKSKQQKDLLLLFGTALFLGAFFTAGSHPPLGFIYTLFYEFIPGFSIFRSPFYKFGSALFIAASVLIAFSISCIIENLTSKLTNKYKHTFGIIFAMAAVGLWLGFYGVLFNPKDVFTWHPELSTRLVLPTYVYDFAKWFDNQETGDSRTLLLPPVNNSWKNDAYSWGYWSLTNLPSVLSNKPFVVNGGLDEGEEIWVDRLYILLEQGDEKGAFNLSKRLGIDYILLRNDVLADSSWSAAKAPELYADKINSFTNLTKIAVFEKWSIYKFNRNASPLFSATNGIISINGNYQYLSQNFFDTDNSISEPDPSTYAGYLSKIVNEYSCQSCPLEVKDALTSLPSVTILPNSPFYIFKQWKEEKTLSSVSNDINKADAYLGFVLRRGAEIKTMRDFGLNTDYAVDSLSKINGYLKSIYVIYSSGDVDQYFKAKRLVDNLNVVEEAFKESVSNFDFGTKKQDYRQGVLDVLWNIKKLKNLFPIIDDKNKLETEKVYSVLPEAGANRTLYIDENSLPRDLNNDPILPKKITFTSGKNIVDVNFQKTNTSLLRLNMPKSYEAGKIIINFSRFPNLFIGKGFYTEQTPTGQRLCLEGTLANFNPDRKYRVEVVATKPWQVLKLFLKDGEIQNGDSHFIQGQDEAEIPPTLSFTPFYHIYTPSGGASSLDIYLCNSNITPPEIENFEFHEMVSPSIIAVDSLPQKINSYPNISYQKIDPTHFKINIQGATNPFILVFNEAYNPAWRLSMPDSTHFSINGYANAWKVSKTGTYVLDLLYSPQADFKKGVIISLVSVSFALGLLVVSTLYNRRKNK